MLSLRKTLVLRRKDIIPDTPIRQVCRDNRALCVPGDENNVRFMEGRPSALRWLADLLRVRGEGLNVVIRKKGEKEGKERKNKDGKQKKKHAFQCSSQLPHRPSNQILSS